MFRIPAHIRPTPFWGIVLIIGFFVLLRYWLPILRDMSNR